MSPISPSRCVTHQAVMRPETFRRLAREAGFADVKVLDHIELESQRFYRLDA